MALTDNGNGLSAADVAAVVGNGNGAFGNWADGSFWIIILFLSQVAQTAQLEAFIRANQTTPATTAG